MEYYVGLDMGGTKTDVLIGDETGKILARYVCPTGPVDDYTVFLIDCMVKALSQCDISLCDIHAFSVCVPWITSDESANRYRDYLQQKISNRNIFTHNDSYAAWRSASHCFPGGVLSAGTGASLSFFLEDEGKVLVHGTSVLSEFQAGKAIGRQGFERGFASAQRYYEPTSLSEAVYEFANTNVIEEIRAKIKDESLQYPLFTPYVMDAASKGDKVALELVELVGKGLATHIRAGLTHLCLTDRKLEFILTGGVLKGQGNLLECVIRRCLTDIPTLKLVCAKYEPVYGALMIAYERYNVNKAIVINNEDICTYKLLR